jgi:ribosomal-protein-alanine N-acetyltransferase
VVLEVRVSNLPAQSLYRKYGFDIFTTRQRYYRDNGEDAYEMRLVLSPQVRTGFEARYSALLHQHHFVDRYTDLDANDHSPL